MAAAAAAAKRRKQHESSTTWLLPLLTLLLLAAALLLHAEAAAPSTRTQSAGRLGFLPRSPLGQATSRSSRSSRSQRQNKVTTMSTKSVPADLVQPLAEAPWRTGLEPAEDCGMLAVPAGSVEGTLPADLVGTLYRNGAGRIRVGEKIRYGHWFDGDGFVSAATFTGDGRCYFRQRYLRGPKFVAQEKAGQDKVGPRGVWTQAGGVGVGPAAGGSGSKSSSSSPWAANVMRIPANPINTNVLVLEEGPKAGKVLALCEGGPAFEIDPVSLDLRGQETFGGVKSFFSAHPKIDPETGIIYNQGVILGPAARLNVMKISPDGQVLLQNDVPLPRIQIVHDFVLAGGYIVVLVSPYGTTPAGLMRSLAGLTALGSGYAWRDEEPTRALFFDKETLRLVHDVAVDPPVSNYHFVNGWEVSAATSSSSSSSSSSVVEVVVAKHRAHREKVEDQFKDMYHAYFTPELECETWRYSFAVDPSKGTDGGQLIEAAPFPLAASSPGYELPTVSPHVVGKQHRFAYVNSLIRQEGFVDSVSKLHLDDGGRLETHTASLPPGTFASEAVFIPRAGAGPEAENEDDGYLLFYTLDIGKGTSDLVVLDARAVTSPPLAVVHLPVRVPYSYHGAWTPRTYGLGEGKGMS